MGPNPNHLNRRDNLVYTGQLRSRPIACLPAILIARERLSSVCRVTELERIMQLFSFASSRVFVSQLKRPHDPLTVKIGFKLI